VRFTHDDTIAAISSPAGPGGRAIVRLSGDDAAALAAAVFHATPAISDLPGFRSVDGLIVAGELTLPGRAYVFRGPRSYTRQDVVELHLPGSPAAATRVLAALLAAGARSAEAGEFTARAFFAGRIDLSAAQAVADIIDAADTAQLRSAMATLQGQVHQLCVGLAQRVTSELALVEASIDMAEESLAFDTPAAVAERLATVADDIRAAADRAEEIPEATHQPTVVLAGPPNAGKSSLLNALTGEDRAIVSALAGTTRDVLSAPLDLAGVTVNLTDAAGLGATSDPLAGQADSAARQAARAADVLCLVIDLPEMHLALANDLRDELASLNPAAPLVVLANKIDQVSPPADALAALARQFDTTPLATSATTGDGLDALRSHLTELLHVTTTRSGEAMGLHHRQKLNLLAAADAAALASERLATCDDLADGAEIVALDLRDALAQLGAISGEVVTDDVLAEIFGRFCVGK
jgi:tRNA modification GTPase